MKKAKPFTKADKERIGGDPFMELCCICEPETQKSRTEWHHAFLFKGSQVNNDWAVVPLCYKHHHEDPAALEAAELIALNRATTSELLAISKSTNYIDLRRRLNGEI